MKWQTRHDRWRMPNARRGSVLVIVLWIAFGLVSLALYFANSMNFELRASDNRVCAMAADQAIDGAERYINYLLTQQVLNGSNGVYLTLGDYQCPCRAGRRRPFLDHWPRHKHSGRPGAHVLWPGG